MCGIIGVFNLNNENVSEHLLKSMASKISHRGPDGEGFYLENNLGFAHKRLSIIDLSENGNQPMISEDGNWIIVFNGFIYNYKELRTSLIESGLNFKSTSDTEVICQGLSKYGEKFIEKLNGMFAIAAWKKDSKELFLFRDRFGIKPLYYWFSGDVICFSSEIKAIIEHPEYKIDVDLDVLNEYFTFQNVFTYRTLFKDIWMLPPANSVKLDSYSKFVKHKSWWDYDFTTSDKKMTFEYAKNETKRLFEKAVKRQMISDVPVGSYLSGGMDSGSITAVASQNVDRLSTFTCGFDMSTVTGREANFDERRDAELMANHFKTEHFEQVMNAGDIKWSLPKLV